MGENFYKDNGIRRHQMVKRQLQARGISNTDVLAAMETVPRHLFVDPTFEECAYGDHPLAIDHGQTISQPYIVAYMTQALNPAPGKRILEIGTGCGYQTAVLAELKMEVFTMEIIPELSSQAQVLLKELGYHASFKIGDGHEGWSAYAPFDGIVVTAAPEEVPALLIEQLGENGRLVIPVGQFLQDLFVFKKSKDQLIQLDTLPVRFVPLIKKYCSNSEEDDHFPN